MFYVWLLAIFGSIFFIAGGLMKDKHIETRGMILTTAAVVILAIKDMI